MKRYLTLIMMLFAYICSMEVHAMSGNVQITVPQEASGSVVSYAKVAERDELESERVSEWTEMDIAPEGSLQIDENGKAKIEQLPEGIYQFRISGENGYDFSRALVAIPMWDEEQETMSYEISIFPKYTYTPPQKERMIEVPGTGDDNHRGIYIAVSIISFIIVVIMSCHNRFKCARMSE